MPNFYEGKLTGKGLKPAIIVSRFNSFMSERLLDGALDTLRRHEVEEDDIDIFRVPGAFEIPVMAKILAQEGKYDGILCLGVLIRGSTPHFEYISAEVTKGISQIALEHQIPISFGVITADTIEQAIERAGSKAGNKGQEAAISFLEMTNLIKNLRKG